MRTGIKPALCIATFLASVSPVLAYVEAPMSFGAIVAQSTNIVLMRVEAVDKEKNLIIYRKVQDIKGKHPTDVIKHNIGRGGLRPNEWKPQMDWAEPGKMAVFFYNGGASETCIGKWWYQAYAGGEWWNHSHAEPFLLRSYCGPPEKLVSIVSAMLAGQEVVVTCMVDGNKDDLHNARAKIQRMKVSLKLQDYNAKRDFVGWGGEDFRRIQGMAGFTHISTLGRSDPEAQAISVVDFDADGKLDLCLVGGGRLNLLQNGGDALSESTLPIRIGGRSAVWADYNADGKPDVFLATPAGPKVLTNLGGAFRDDSQILPPDVKGPITAAVWLDYDNDGLPDLLLADGYNGLRLLRNNGAVKDAGKEAPKVLAFEDVSKAVGFGPGTATAGLKGDALSVCDVDRDGRPDFLFSAGKGMLFLSRGEGKGKTVFELAKDSGIEYSVGRIGPTFADIDGDDLPDLIVPQKGAVKVFRNAGKGKFEDASSKTGELANFKGWATSVAVADFDHDGVADLFIGCLRGPNAFFRGKGNATFEDATEAIGLSTQVFNTQAVSLLDLNNDGFLDVVFNNEGQESVVLLGSTSPSGKRVSVSLIIPGLKGVLGSHVEVQSKDGKRVASSELSGGDGRGGQLAPLARFTLDPGKYRVIVRLSTGETRTQEISIGDSPLRAKVDQSGD